MPDPRPLYPIVRRHLDALTGPVGIMQHAVGSRPDPAHGSCTDDGARALQVDLLHGRELGWAAVAESTWRSMRFLDSAFDESAGTFRNFRSVDGAWLPGIPSEDCQGRAMLALGDVIAESPDAAMVTLATLRFDAGLPAAGGVTALRAAASVLLGCAMAAGVAPGSHAAAALRPLAVAFHSRFPVVEDTAWPWPEPSLTYENALPARALIVAGRALGIDEMTDRGLRILDWQIAVQTSGDGRFSPIGNQWWPRDGIRSRFDQQPIEATALILATRAAFEATADRRYRTAMERAYGWFLGDNDGEIAVADPRRGAGFDGLTPSGVNVNQGAESTLMWLMALEHVRSARASDPVASSARATATPPVLVGATR